MSSFQFKCIRFLGRVAESNLPIFIANGPLGSLDKDIAVDITDLGLGNTKLRFFSILNDECSYYPVCTPLIRYCLPNSSRLQGAESPLVKAFTEKELGKYKESVDEPCREEITTDELKKKSGQCPSPWRQMSFLQKKGGQNCGGLSNSALLVLLGPSVT